MMLPNKAFIIGLLVLGIAGSSAILAGTTIYLPALNISGAYSGPTATRDPCAPNPYPAPTAVYCPTLTPTYNPYPVPATQTPIAATVTPDPNLDRRLFLPQLNQ